MMRLILGYYDMCGEALSKDAPIEALVSLPVREKIGRFKYVREEDIDAEYESVTNQLKRSQFGVKKGGVLMPKEYRTIEEVAGPLMLIKNVSRVTYNELGEIELGTAKHAAAVCLK